MLQKTGRPLPRRDFVIELNKTLARVLNYDLFRIKYALVHMHSYGGHETALMNFPEIHYFACVRDPRENWLSWHKICEIRHGDLFAERKLREEIIIYLDTPELFKICFRFQGN